MGHITTAQFLAAYAIGAAIGTAVFFHAERHGSRRASVWASAVFLCLGVALPVYVIHVVRSRRAQSGR